MERKEIEGMLNFLGTRKDESQQRGTYSESLYQTIAQCVIAQQLMLLVEQGARPKVDIDKLADDILEELEGDEEIMDRALAATTIWDVLKKYKI